jgi:phosphoglycolate phosphatase-like HAD superfamily hydrolase
MKTSRDLKGIVFDLDGTLVDSLGTTFEAFNHAIVGSGGAKHTPSEIMAHFGTGESQIFAKILGEEKAASAYVLAREYMDRNLDRVPLHQGVGDLLEKFKSADIPISIFTGRSWETTHMILKHHSLLDRFITVVANDHVGQPKPSPEGLLLALSRMALLPHEVFFIGDSPVDILAGKSAGSPSIAALWDLVAEKDLLSPCEPDHWAEHPLHVWDIWEAERNSNYLSERVES